MQRLFATTSIVSALLLSSIVNASAEMCPGCGHTVNIMIKCTVTNPPTPTTFNCMSNKTITTYTVLLKDQPPHSKTTFYLGSAGTNFDDLHKNMTILLETWTDKPTIAAVVALSPQL